MKKPILGIVFLLLFGLGVSAQATERAVEKIGAYYNEIAEKARLAETDDDRGEFGDLVINELVINKRNHQWRAVGIYGLTYKFFYKGGDSEEHLYPDQLVKVVVDKKISNRSYVEEFLYAENGSLIFYFQKAEHDDQQPGERRVYFAGVKAIRIVEDEKSRDRLTAKDAVTVKDLIADSAKIQEIFIRSIKL